MLDWVIVGSGNGTDHMFCTQRGSFCNLKEEIVWLIFTLVRCILMTKMPSSLLTLLPDWLSYLEGRVRLRMLD